MKITELYVYPIKALRGIKLQTALIGPQGIQHDRTFMLFKVEQADDVTSQRPPRMTKLQLDKFPQCALFTQTLTDDGTGIQVRYRVPDVPLAPAHPLQQTPLTVPLRPDLASLKPINVDLHGSGAAAYRMGGYYDEWFTACFGFATMLVYLGDGRRAVLGTLSPKTQRKPQQQQQQQQSSGWLSSVWSKAAALTISSDTSAPKATQEAADWLTFTDVAPLLITTEPSLCEIRARLPADTPLDLVRFRPNVVVGDGGEPAWAEDFWSRIRLGPSSSSGSGFGSGGALTVHLTANCGRCTSLNVDYDAGASGDPAGHGAVLKSLMRDRRVDPGHKWSPVFGRYGFPDGEELALSVASSGTDGQTGTGDNFFRVSVGDVAEVTGRRADRTVFDWDI